MQNLSRTLCFVATLVLLFLSKTTAACDVNVNGSWNDRDLAGNEISKIVQIRVFEGQYSVFRVVQRLETTYLLADGQTKRTICHGDSGGTLIRTLNLVDGEYIQEMHILYGAVVDHVRFVTNLGTDTGTLGGGGGLGSSKSTFSKKGFYIQALVGASAGRIDRLDEPIYQSIPTAPSTGAPTVTPTAQPTVWPATTTLSPATSSVTQTPTITIATKAPLSTSQQTALEDSSNSAAVKVGVGIAVVVLVLIALCGFWAWNKQRQQRMGPPGAKSDQDEPVAIRAYAVQSHAFMNHPSIQPDAGSSNDNSAELLEAQVLPMMEETTECSTCHDVAVVVSGQPPVDQNLRDFRNKTRRTRAPAKATEKPSMDQNLRDFQRKTELYASGTPQH